MCVVSRLLCFALLLISSSLMSSREIDGRAEIRARGRDVLVPNQESTGHAVLVISNRDIAYDANALAEQFRRRSSTEVIEDDTEDGIITIAAGFHYTCALFRSGIVKCWGSDLVSGFGAGVMHALGPTEIDGLRHVVAIAVGSSHAFALLWAVR